MIGGEKILASRSGGSAGGIRAGFRVLTQVRLVSTAI